MTSIRDELAHAAAMLTAGVIGLINPAKHPPTTLGSHRLRLRGLLRPPGLAPPPPTQRVLMTRPDRRKDHPMNLDSEPSPRSDPDLDHRPAFACLLTEDTDDEAYAALPDCEHCQGTGKDLTDTPWEDPR